MCLLCASQQKKCEAIFIRFCSLRKVIKEGADNLQYFKTLQANHFCLRQIFANNENMMVIAEGFKKKGQDVQSCLKTGTDI